MQNVCADFVEEAGVVRDDEGGDVGVGLEVVLEPLDVGNIEMVGRFVEEEDISTHQHGAGQSQLHLPTTRQRADLLLLATLGAAGESDLLEDSNNTVLALSLELRILDSVVQNGKISVFTLVVLNEAGLDLVLGWEAVQLASSDGAHEGTLTATVATTETVAVTLEEAKVGV